MKEERSHPSPRPRKSWGQNFLIDYNIQRKILDLARIGPGERVAEIGPGRGILTAGLLERGAEVIALEIDPALVDILGKEIAHPRLKLVLTDALRYPYEEIPAPYKVVSNLPYYLSTPLLFRLLEARDRISTMVLMLQKEVAERLTAPHGNKNYGALSVAVQFYADVRIAWTVSRTCFRPQPQVDSAVIVLTPLLSPRFPVRDESLFLRLVRGAFGHRRKRVVNALVDAGFPKKPVESGLARSGIDPGLRGEKLSLSQFAQLADILFDISVNL